MIGLLVAVALSWALLRCLTGEALSVLGIAPNLRRTREFILGLVFMALTAVINFMWQAYFKQISYAINPEYNLSELFRGVSWTLKSVLFEELVFRGVLLFLLIKRFGVVKACLCSSIAFGVYHWFSYELFGSRIVVMIFIFLVTGCGGWMFAFAYAKTKSLYAPIGLHLGWNLVSAIVFSSGPIGNQCLLQQGVAAQMNVWASFLFFSLQALVAPGLVTWFLLKRDSQVPQIDSGA